MNNWDDDSDPEFPDDWEEDGGETLTRVCPHCSCDVYEDAEQCPLCGEWISRPLTAWEGRPTWWIILGLLGIGAVLFGWVFLI